MVAGSGCLVVVDGGRSTPSPSTCCAIFTMTRSPLTTWSTHHTLFYTLFITYSSSYTLHHTIFITHSLSHTLYQTLFITHTLHNTLSSTHSSSYTFHHTLFITHFITCSLSHSLSHTCRGLEPAISRLRGKGVSTRLVRMDQFIHNLELVPCDSTGPNQ